MQTKLKHANISIFIPHLGCPFNCIFCDQYKITGSDQAVTPSDVFSTLSKAKENISKTDAKHTQIAFFGGSFTAIDTDLMIEYLKTANMFVGENGFESIRISTRPDCINYKILNILKQYNVKTIELGIQSLDNDVLKKSKRGHNAEQSIAACKLIQQNGFELGMQMMCGLPGDSFEKDIETAKQIIDIGCKQVRIYPVVVIEGTKLFKMYTDQTYTPLSLDEAVKTCAELYALFDKNNVTVLKMGLHTSSNSVAGPFHPAFGELVRSEIFYNTLTSQIKKGTPVTVFVSPSFISIAKGNSKKNLKKFEQNGYKVSIQIDHQLNSSEYRIKTDIE